MAKSLLLQKKERDDLYHRIECLEIDLKTSQENMKYYADRLGEVREEIINIFNLVGAKSHVADEETVDQAWDRYIQAIKDRVKK